MKEAKKPSAQYDMITFYIKKKYRLPIDYAY